MEHECAKDIITELCAEKIAKSIWCSENSRSIMIDRFVVHINYCLNFVNGSRKERERVMDWKRDKKLITCGQ